MKQPAAETASPDDRESGAAAIIAAPVHKSPRAIIPDL
jgi:hypothetical protein